MTKLSLANEKRCSRCDALLPSYAIFCGTCGERVEKSITSLQSLDDADFAERYRIISLVYSRPYVQLFHATDNQHQRSVIIRDIDLSSLNDEARACACTAAQQEYDLLRHQRVPGVMPVIDLRYSQGHLFTVANWPFRAGASEQANAMLYLLLTGTSPGAPGMQRPLHTPRDLNPYISSDVDEVIMRALSTERSDHFQSAGEMAEAVSQLYLDASDDTLRIQRLPRTTRDLNPQIGSDVDETAVVERALEAPAASAPKDEALRKQEPSGQAQLEQAQQVKRSSLSTASDASDVSRRAHVLHDILGDVACALLPPGAFILWFLSLKGINIRQMTDLGLVSVLSPLTIVALVILMMSFCLTLCRSRMRAPILLLHLVLLIFMLYGITTLVEEAPRFAVVYRHAGYTEYIMRTGSVDPGLDAYFNWPGFFVLSAFLTRIAGYHDILAYAAWAPVFLNLIYLGPLYLIFTSATTNTRLVWLGLWFFYLTNWIGQDYFSPQGFNFFLYLVIIAILLRWFKAPPPAQPRVWRRQRQGRFSPLARWLYAWLTAPDEIRTASQPRQRIALLVSLILVFALVVFSHPLTPFFVIASVSALAIFRRCTPRWLPILMGVMTAAWFIFMAQAYLAGHIDALIGDLGHLGSAVSANVTDRVAQGNPEHTFIAEIRVIMTLFLWGLACIGGVLRLRQGHRDITYVLLALAPFSLFVAQQYGGEMLLRIYLFSLPMMVFFAAAIFSIPSVRGMSRWMPIAIAGISILLLGGFLFTRYGNERADYMTYAEVDGVRHLYSIAQPYSLLLAGWDGTPWQSQDDEKYSIYSMTDSLPKAVVTKDVNAVVQFLERQKPSHAYLIFTRSQKVTFDETSGLPPGSLDRLEDTVRASSNFKMVYSNADAQIFTFVANTAGGTP